MTEEEKRFEDYKRLVGEWFIHENGRGRYQVAKFLETTFFHGAPGFKIYGYRPDGRKRPGSFVERCDVFLSEYIPISVVYPQQQHERHPCSKKSTTSSEDSTDSAAQH